MVQSVVIPQNTNFEMVVSLPADYVGKTARVLFYLDEEVRKTTAALGSRKKPSDFFGTLSSEEGEKKQTYIEQSRSEWERNI